VSLFIDKNCKMREVLLMIV